MAATAAIGPPASPFSTLLRSSRFASYDPYIRQTYSSPLPAYSSRGNWGLKRPISLRRRNAFITLKKYEEHAQFVEWSHAESQVRFVRRVEAMNILPRVVRGTGWAKGLGWGEEGVWSVDSEFGEAEWGGEEVKMGVEETNLEGRQKKVEAQETQPKQERDVDLRMLGHKGRGSYSPKRLYSTNVQELIPNIEAMSPREFEKFLTKLRESRGEFGEHLRGVMKRRAGENGGDGEKSMFELALQNAEETDYHMAFIGVRTANEYRRTLQDDLKAVKDAQSSTDYSTRVKHYPIHAPTTTKNGAGWHPKIKPQPHRTGGLLYSHPTMLETYLTTKPQSGIVLQEKYTDQGRFSLKLGGEDGAKKAFVASFGGLLAEMGVRESANTPPLVTNVNSHAGGAVGEVEKSVAQMRIKTLDVEKPPRVVGRRGQGLKAVGVRASVMVDVPHAERARENAFRPGSWEYVRAERVETKPMRLVNLTSSSYGTGKKMYAVKERTEAEKKKGNLKILGMLRNTVTKKGIKNGEGEGGPEDL